MAHETLSRPKLRPQAFQMGHARVVGKTIYLHIHPEKVVPAPSGLVAIRFKPTRTRGIETYKAVKIIFPDVEGEQATSPDISHVAGRPWFDAGTVHARRRVLNWLEGLCECCGNEAAWPSLLEGEH